MTDTPFLEVNGEILEYSRDSLPATVTQLLETLGIDSKTIVAEINGEIVKRRDFSNHTLASGDKVELVRFVGGG